MPLYALIDPYLGDYPEHGVDLSKCGTFDSICEIRKGAWQGCEVHLALGKEPVATVDRLPYVVDLSKASADQIETLTRVAREEHQSALDGDTPRYRIGALIETWMAGSDLMRRLESMWRYKHGIGGRQYLRIADRRVFEGLTHVLDARTMKRWLGPIYAWHFIGRSMRWMSVYGEASEGDLWYSDSGFGMRRTVPSARANDAATLMLGANQKWQLAEFETVSRVLLECQIRGGAPDADAYQKAWAGAREASRYGLSDAADKAAFVSRWMIDADCANRAPVNHAVQLANSHNGTFADALVAFEAHEILRKKSKT